MKRVRRRTSRIGEKYQAELDGMFLDRRALLAARSREMFNKKRSRLSDEEEPVLVKANVIRDHPDCHCVWDPKETEEPLVSQFLTDIREIYPQPFCISPEKALRLLRDLNYDTEACISRLTSICHSIPPLELDESIDLNLVFEVADDFVCFLCRDFGDLVVCDREDCLRVYHLKCLKLTQVPDGTWECPIHVCATCKERISPSDVFPCLLCGSSYCKSHQQDISSRQNSVSALLCNDCADKTSSDAQIFNNHLMTMHRMLRKPISRVPTLKSSSDGMFQLYRKVIELGGSSEIRSDSSKWQSLAEQFGIFSTGGSKALEVQKLYASLLLPYERLFSKHSWGQEDTNRIKTQRKAKYDSTDLTDLQNGKNGSKSAEQEFVDAFLYIPCEIDELP